MAMRSPSLLLAVEVLGLVAFLVLCGVQLIDSQAETTLIPLSAEALTTTDGDERWQGVFFQDTHVGFTVTRSSPVTSGGTLYEGRSSFRIATFGQLQEVTTAGAALTDTDGQLRRFDFFMSAGGVQLIARGEVSGDQIIMEVNQAGEVSTIAFDIDAPPHVSLSLEEAIRRTELSVGLSFSVPYFDPVTLSQGEMEIKVEGVEILENSEEAYWIRSRMGDIETRSLVTPAGEMLRQEGALGMSLVRMSPEEATNISDADEPVDLIALSAVKLTGQIPKARSTRKLTLQITGVEPDRVLHQPPLQSRQGDRVTVDIPLLLELPELPVADRSEPEWLTDSPTLPVYHPEIAERAAAVVSDATTRLEAVKRLNTFVFEYLEKVPVIGVPNGLSVLRSGQGDCNEHTALFVSLARAAGIPTRIAAGVVYSSRISPQGAFYYHAWPEVRLEGPTGWVPVDPTFGQVPADATHIKLVEGDLDRQVEIMGVMGRLGFVSIEHK
ncbi:MAG: transglutaminase-like domain-containing protein [Myxococcota bacterium]|nr:transglutaminase-like domain-containing protein [Myxococcota bacterium]